jgi:hypothetical protein
MLIVLFWPQAGSQRCRWCPTSGIKDPEEVAFQICLRAGLFWLITTTTQTTVALFFKYSTRSLFDVTTVSLAHFVPSFLLLRSCAQVSSRARLSCPLPLSTRFCLSLSPPLSYSNIAPLAYRASTLLNRKMDSDVSEASNFSLDDDSDGYAPAPVSPPHL